MHKRLAFVQLYPRLSSLQLQRYWQLTDIFVKEDKHQAEIYAALFLKQKSLSVIHNLTV